ncbi:MAG TPA: polyhydroxyalkanoate granule-associated phasin [Casimicrobiaceae bacterium]|jgi:hypothetical protein
MSKRRLITKTSELSLVAPQVVALRFARLLAAGASPTARDRRESARMVNEKIAAFSEAWIAMAAQMQRSNQEWALFTMRQWWSAAIDPSWMLQTWGTPRRWLRTGATRRKMQTSMVKLVTAGLTPIHKRATRNVRRLSARKSR